MCVCVSSVQPAFKMHALAHVATLVTPRCSRYIVIVSPCPSMLLLDVHSFFCSHFPTPRGLPGDNVLPRLRTQCQCIHLHTVGLVEGRTHSQTYK